MELNERYKALQKIVVERRESFYTFLRYLEEETTWLKSPASTRYHLSEERGLLRHSVGVAENLLKFRSFLAPCISEESCVVVGLFHDVGKLGSQGKPLYIFRDEQCLIRSRIRYTINPDVTAMGLAMRSLYIVTKHIQLSDEEAQAIAYHDGQYIDENRIVAHKEAPLTLLAHWADYWTAHMYEERKFDMF